MKVYLAAAYHRKSEMREVRDQMQNAGVEVTSRWLDEDLPDDTQLSETTSEFCYQTARQDLRDIAKADTVVFFSEHPDVWVPRGGRHFEFGVAWATGKALVVIGPRENIFHFLDEVTVYPDVFTFLQKESPRAVAAH